MERICALLNLMLAVFCLSCHKPKPCINPSVSTSNLGQEIVFLDCSEHSANYMYDFGDGSLKVNEQSPRHTYTKPGSYTVIQEVTNRKGNKETQASVVVTVNGINVGDFTVNEWVLYKTAQYDDNGSFEEMNVQAPNHTYKFTPDSVYIYDGFSLPVSQHFSVISNNQIRLNGNTFTVIRNHDKEIWYRDSNVGVYTQYFLKKKV